MERVADSDNIEKAVQIRVVDGLSGSVEEMLPHLPCERLPISKYYLPWTGFTSQTIFNSPNQFNGIVRFSNKVHSPSSLGTFAIVASRPG
jgi:hypothetical protein